MKFFALALVGVAALTAQSALAQETQVTTCDVECVGPYNECGWDAIYGKGTQADCDTKNAKCIKDCVTKNGSKPYVYQPKATATTGTTTSTTAKTGTTTSTTAKTGTTTTTTAKTGTTTAKTGTTTATTTKK